MQKATIKLIIGRAVAIKSNVFIILVNKVADFKHTNDKITTGF